MKKKTKFKLSNNLVVPFWTAVGLLTVCAILHSVLFYNNLFKVLSKLNEEPIATITFKYKTAQRKFLARNIWDRLRNNSPVYNGDTIHTSSLSEATIHFSDGNTMELMENTMAQVFLNQAEGVIAEFEAGNAVFDTTGSDYGITLKTGGMQVNIESGSSLSAGFSGDKTSALGAVLQMITGKANISAGSQNRSLGAGESILVDPNNADAVLEPPVVVLSPVANQKFLYHDQSEYQVDFKFKARDDFQNTSDCVLVIAKDKNFRSVVRQLSVDFSAEKLFSIEVSLAAGTYYWKLAGIDSFVPMGKMQVIQALPPSLIAPVTEYVYTYRTRSPAVRLIWSDIPVATSYLVEIARDSDFKDIVLSQSNGTTSSIISTLTHGKYYWRVTPFFTIANRGYAAVSSASTFNVEKRNLMHSPRLLAPVGGAIVNTDSAANAVAFSWKADIDAAGYTLSLSRNEDMSNPFFKQEVSDNFYRISDIGKYSADGKWYWSVTSYDVEGNVSKNPYVNMIYAMKGETEQHTIEPLNGYKVTEGLLADMRFTWKKNLPDYFTSTLEIAQDSNFSRVVFSQDVIGSSYSVKSLPLGDYYWRLKSTGGEMVLDTNPKLLSVVGNLDKAVVTNPVDKMVVREGIPAQFAWQPVKDAHYYKITILTPDGKVPLYQDTVYEPKAAVDMSKGFTDRNYYKLQVQAFSFEVPGVSSRRSGALSEKNFVFRLLRPVDIEYPKQAEVIDGATAILKPKTAVWSAVDDLSQAQFVLTRIEGKKQVDVIKIPSDAQMARGIRVAPNRVLLDVPEGLRPGTYQIVVHALTKDGIDISNTQSEYLRTFVIGEIPKLAASKNLKATPENFDAKYLVQKDSKRVITLNWDKVDSATDYRLTVIKDRKVVLNKMTDKLNYTIDFMQLKAEERAVFSRGNFTFQVEALRRVDSDKDGKLDKIFQEGNISSGKFSTDIPVPSKVKTKGAVNPYGQ